MKNLDESALIERLRHLRLQFYGERGKSKFASALGVSPSTYSYYEKDRVPPIELLLKVSEVTGADLEWLLTGREADKTFPQTAHSSLLRTLHQLLSEKPDLAGPVSAFIQILAEKQAFQASRDPTSSPTDPNRPGWIPVLGRTAAGIVHVWNETFIADPDRAATELEELVKRHLGKKILASANAPLAVDLQARPLLDGLKSAQANLVRVTADDDEILEFVESPKIHSLLPDSFALHIDGDSMAPRINDGDIIVLSPSVPAAQGQVAVARIRDQIGVTCKLIRTTEETVHLIPINERFEPKVIPKEQLLWALAVLCHIRL